ncbi:adenylyltransferase/cytidyltransferase family protein [Candidatus Gracilibacteria bacterium]|nr:adenylyltransferase/cytidyltransferase family protein [Candidatus Gracilibacteria bacterium]
MDKFNKLFVAGAFDSFHVGHQFFLWQASAMCKELVIVVARDSSIKRIKNHTPKNTEEDRLKRIKDENLFNAKVRLGKEGENCLETLREENPDALLLGYDQNFDEEKCRKHFPNLIILRAESFAPDLFKSSKFD